MKKATKACFSHSVMPPKTRATRITKTSKENIGVVEKTKLKGVTKVSKPRKALADKTNSASDDNASTEIPKKVAKKAIVKGVENDNNKARPRRERRLPTRFVENQILNNLSNSKEVETNSPGDAKSTSSNKNGSAMLSPFKTPEKVADCSLVANRPRRVCRLPSKFDDHSVSPNKFIPVGCHASTPILHSKSKPDNKTNEKPTSLKVAKQPKVPTKKVTTKKVSEESPLSKLDNNPDKISTKKSPVKKSTVKAKADTNNNGKQKQLQVKLVKTNLTTIKDHFQKDTGTKSKSKSPKKLSPAKSGLRSKPQAKELSPVPVKSHLNFKPSPKKLSPLKTGTKILQKNSSFKVLEDKRALKRDNSHLDVYEFTFDPTEEPPPQKKKRKKVVKKKPAKPKTVVFKSNYDQNVNKALAALKNVVSKKAPPPAVKENVPQKPPNTQVPQIVVNNTPIENTNVAHNMTQEKNYVSIGIEDIAADIEPLDHHEINYSPVNTPHHVGSPMPSSRGHSVERQYQDPLNLQECISFFDEPPVASSSMNMSTRKPNETPWRVEFEKLPIKWHVNAYVKPNMTPAVESSFINCEDIKKKHVYTNMVPEDNVELPEIVENDRPNLKQTSIISFIREVAQRSATKKKRGKSVTPTKANSIFEDISNISVTTNKDVYKTPNKTPRREDPVNSTPNRDEDVIELENNEDKENSNEGKKSKKAGKKSGEKKNKDGTFFGFDESEDMENVSPVKIDNPRVRALRPRARAVLQEINAETGPTRAKLPLAAKTKIVASSEAVNKVYDGVKSATDAPDFPEKDVDNVAATEVGEQFNAVDDDDSQSVHLFEDIEVVHHLKPTRKSYGKAPKKVAFQATSSDSESNIVEPIREPDSADEEDDLADLTFTMPDVQQKSRPKKKKKKDVLSKKEKAELEAWAAGFNSMCEDVEEFPLLVE